VEYFGILIEKLREIPDDIINDMPKYLSKKITSDKLKKYKDNWTDGGAEEFFGIYPRDSNYLEHLLEILQDPSLKNSTEHFVEWLKRGEY
jgi:hypothetical protein